VQFTPIGAEQVRASLAYYSRANLLPPATSLGSTRVANALPSGDRPHQQVAGLLMA
jgi:hypothetical protein